MVDKKVLWNEGTAKLGGAQYNHILLQEYRPKGWEAVAILPEDGPLVEELEKHGVEVICIRSGPSWSISFHLGNRTLINPLALFWLGVQTLFIAMPKYYFAIRKVHPDVVVTNSMIAHIFGRFAAFLTGKKRILRLEDILRSGGLFSIVKWKFKLFFRYPSNGIIVPSKSVRDLNFSNSQILNKTRVIYNSQPFAEDQEVEPSLRKEFDLDGPTVGVMSRLTPWKGHKELIHAFKEVVKESPEATLLIVGGDLFAPGGYLQDLMDLVEQLGLKKNVIFTGFRRDLENCISSFDLAVLPSILPDPCPRVLFEFMERSRPIIATPFGGAPEIIEDGVSGRIIDPNDGAALAQSIVELLSNKEKRNALGKEARIRLENQFPFENYVDEHYSFFEDIVGKR